MAVEREVSIRSIAVRSWSLRSLNPVPVPEADAAAVEVASGAGGAGGAGGADRARGVGDTTIGASAVPLGLSHCSLPDADAAADAPDAAADGADIPKSFGRSGSSSFASESNALS